MRAVERLVQVVVFRVTEAARRRAARRNVRARLEDAPGGPAELGPALVVWVRVRRQRRHGQSSVLRSGSRCLHLLENDLLFEGLWARCRRSIGQVLAILARFADVIQRDAVQMLPNLRSVRTCCRHIYPIFGEHNLLAVGRRRYICIVIALLFSCTRSRRGGHQVLGVIQIVGVLRLLRLRRRAGRGAGLSDAKYFAQIAVAAAYALIRVMKIVENLRICV